ncbi:MAG: RNA 2'-phosphotransferase [candidate division NC10 bacterium]|nr:RNA 2'-phosphotransferase [candidate division NC10 bacterium]
MDKYQRERLSKLLSYILRHRPDEYGLVLDPEGYVSVKELIQALHEEKDWSFVRADHLQEIALTSDRARFEMEEGRIRATYGHTLPIKIEYQQAEPPKVLYHGTRRRAYPVILAHGLRPMGRQYVHLTTHQELALRIGKRRDPDPVLLEVHALRAHQDGIPFYRANELIFLVASLPPHYLSGPPLSKVKIERPMKEEKKEFAASPFSVADLGLQPFLPPPSRRRQDKLPDWKRQTRRWRRRRDKEPF